MSGKAMKVKNENQTISQVALIACVACSSAWADDLPLTVEDLITDKGKFKLDLSFAYANSEEQGVSTGAPVLVQTGASSFVAVPTSVRGTQQQQ